jgi:KaiC/GvpD/RAD55 family RecA-like ATPase
VAEFEEWLGGASGSFVVHAPPLSGPTQFVDAVGRYHPGTALLIAATTGLARTPASALDAVASIVDCSPTESGSAGSVSSPADLTGVSMPVSEFLKATDRPVLAVDSLSTILYYADDVAVFRFLNVLSAHIRRRDGLGLFVLTPGAHDDRTVHTFAQAFDGRIDLERDRVRARAADAPEGWHDR